MCLSTFLQRAVTGSAESFLKHIYEKHPPKNPDHKLGPLSKDPDVTKKALLRAISHYHTDKNLAAKHGKKWEVLCGVSELNTNRSRKARKGICLLGTCVVANADRELIDHCHRVRPSCATLKLNIAL